MLVGQHYYLLRVTPRVLTIANERIPLNADFKNFNYCTECKTAYAKSEMICVKCKIPLKTQKTRHLTCINCGVSISLGDICTNKKSTKNSKYMCMLCSLQIGRISKKDLDAFCMKHTVNILVLCVPVVA